MNKNLKNLQIGEETDLGMIKEIQIHYLDYNRSRTSVKIIYNNGESLTDAEIMPVVAGCELWICTKAIHEKSSFIINDFKVKEEKNCILQNFFEVSTKDLKDIEVKYKEFVSYAIKKLF